MSAAFTKGPWAHDGCVVYKKENEYAICDVYSPLDGPSIWRNSEEEAEANAHLIAASPALYDALEALLDDIGEAGSDGYCENSIHIVEVRAARAALALARGGAV